MRRCREGYGSTDLKLILSEPRNNDHPKLLPWKLIEGRSRTGIGNELLSQTQQAVGDASMPDEHRVLPRWDGELLQMSVHYISSPQASVLRDRSAKALELSSSGKGFLQAPSAKALYPRRLALDA